tara:strand:- start:4658 stop:7024 length:2367 start_codon:yes stop_codon:yes gene_type:complete
VGSLSRTFTFGRNALKRDAATSATAAMRAIDSVLAGVDLKSLKASDNGAYNVVRDLISFTGVLRRNGDHGEVTALGDVFVRLYGQSPTDAWRWLLTRSLWLYTVPNGTQASVNESANEAGANFDPFRRFLALCVSISTLSGEARFISFEELCALYDADDAWTADPSELHTRVLAQRANNPDIATSPRSLLGDLESTYGIPRDNFSTFFVKAAGQTGLFEFRVTGTRTTAIALGSQLDQVLQRRVRFILDHPQRFETEWDQHLQLRAIDMPQEVSLQQTEEATEPEVPEELRGMVTAAVADFADSGLIFGPNLIARFAAALLAKRFVILSGLSGSGKTKLAQAFAIWLTPPSVAVARPFKVGDLITSDRVEYRVTQADTLSVELVSGETETKVVLPLGLVDEWVRAIVENGLNRSAAPRAIRNLVTPNTRYTTQLSSFESHLKALAFAVLARTAASEPAKRYEIVSVGPDWTSREASLGYVDALDADHYVRSTPIVNLILRARAAPQSPFFLVLDEMNLSHVERYFSEFLSSIESEEAMFLHGGLVDIDGVPPSVQWPNNLFVVGTVNVDETTYMFSPKVLDRANTIEFRISDEGMDAYLLQSGASIEIRDLAGRGAKFSDAFMHHASGAHVVTEAGRLAAELKLLFSILRPHGGEFGFRTVREIQRYFTAMEALIPDVDFFHPLDIQVLQKILPRLSGPRRRLEGVLCALGIYCAYPREWDANTASLVNVDSILEAAARAGKSGETTLHPLSENFAYEHNAMLPVALDKIKRMLSRLETDGFASFAEA